MSLLNVPSTPLTVYSQTDATDWNQTEPVCDSLGWTFLVIWPIRLQTQVMSPSSASMSVASTRRSTFRPGTWASSKGTTRQSLLASEDLNLPQHSGASSSSQHTAASSSHSVETWFIRDSASGNCRRITILLQVGLASRKLLRTWIVKQLFQVLWRLCQRRREIKTETSCKH